MLEIYALNLNGKKPIYVNQFFWTLKLLLLFKSYEKKPRHTEPTSSFKHLPSGNKFSWLMNNKMIDAYGGNPTQISIANHLRFLYLSKEMELIYPQVNTMLQNAFIILLCDFKNKYTSRLKSLRFPSPNFNFSAHKDNLFHLCLSLLKLLIHFHST